MGPILCFVKVTTDQTGVVRWCSSDIGSYELNVDDPVVQPCHEHRLIMSLSFVWR